MWRAVLLGGLVATWLAACSFIDRDSRYSIEQDTAPERAISADAVADAIPRPDPILAAGNKSPYTVNGVTYEVLASHQGYSEEGIASWYGAKFHGHATSNGEIFDQYAATAAHKTLPLPSYVRVTNLDNQMAMVVRVNDRGPFHPDRLIDLSYAAAVKLGFQTQGTARVKVESIDLSGVDDRRGVPLGDYRFLQVGAFGLQASALQLQAELQTLVNAPVSVSPVDTSQGKLYRVRVGPMASNAQIEAVQNTLRDAGHQPGQPLP